VNIQERTVDLTVEDLDSEKTPIVTENPSSAPIAVKKTRNSSLEKKNRGNTLGANLKMKLEIMLPPEEEEDE
jgi:hypothetical protein